MQLIIKCTEQTYSECKKISGLSETAFIIANGTPYNPSGDCISREALKKAIKDNGYSHYFKIFDIIDNVPPAEPICPYLSDNEVKQPCLNSPCERPQGECRTCRHRDPEDKKCDCGALERAGCPFPVSNDYFCKFYEKGGAG